MNRLLLTAFRPYGAHAHNTSAEVQRALIDRRRTAGRDSGLDAASGSGPLPEFATALYDVDFSRIEGDLQRDLTDDVQVALLMGQAPGRATIDLETFAINAGVEPGTPGESWFALDPQGPAGLRSDLPLDAWTRRLQESGFAARQSFHAGTYLCNASLYHALRHFQRRGLPGAAVFLHLPLAKEFATSAAVAPPMETLLGAVEATIALAAEWIAERETHGERRLA